MSLDTQPRITLDCGDERDYLLKKDAVNCRQKVELNSKSTLEFSIRRDNPKAKYFDYADTTATINGRVYCMIGEDGPEDVLDETAKDENSTLINVVMKELWYKLGKSYITAYNVNVETSSEFDHIDTHMVVLLGNSNDSLYINGVRKTAPYPVGTAKYFFWCLLDGSGWSLDSRYDAYWPDGTFDLETDKKSRLENIEVLQSLFGGFLLWDSTGKRVALVDEGKYQVDDGFDVCFGRQKGALLKARKRKESRDITTRLYVYGNSYLNIADVNGGKEYLDNRSYTSEVLEGIVQHNDIYRQDTLLAWGKKQSEKLCKPRFSYEIELLDMREKEAPQAPGPELAKMCTVHDPKQPGGKALLRVTAIDQDPFLHWDKKIEVGDVRDKFPQVMRDVIKAEQTVTNTVSNTNQITGQIIRGETPALTASNLHWTSVTGNLGSGLSMVQQQADQIQLQVDDNKGNIASLTIRADQIQTTVTKMGENQVEMQSQITQQADRISAIVTQDGQVKAASVIGVINNVGYAAIRADRIMFAGDSTTVEGHAVFKNDIGSYGAFNGTACNVATVNCERVFNFQGRSVYIQNGYLRV